MAQQQIVVAMDTARERVLNGRRPAIDVARFDSLEQQIKRLAWNWLNPLAEIGNGRCLRIRAAFALKRDSHGFQILDRRFQIES
jgi:hypothetical protein